MLAAVTWFIAKRNDYPRMPKASFGSSSAPFAKAFGGWR